MAAAKVADAFSQLSPKGNGIVPWRVLEEFLYRLDVEPRAIQACKCVQEPDGTVKSDKLYSWLYESLETEKSEALAAPPPPEMEVVQVEEFQETKCMAKPVFPDELPYEKGLRMHYAVPAWKWCVTRRGFLEFLVAVKDAHKAGRIENNVNPRTQESNPFHDDPSIGPNMHTVNGSVIKPRTIAAGGMSWALMLNPEGLDGPFFFVTHSWKEGVYEFSRKVVHHWQDADLSMWCCFLANPQTWDREELNKLLGERFDLADSPFMKALSASQLHSFVVVPNITESLYCRLWCVAELWKAMEVEKQRGSPLIFVAKDKDGAKKAPDAKGPKDSISTMIQHATCSDEHDERRIRAYIKGNEHHLQDEIKNLAVRAKEREKAKMKEEKKRRKSGKGRDKIVPSGTLGALEAALDEISGTSFAAGSAEYHHAEAETVTMHEACRVVQGPSPRTAPTDQAPMEPIFAEPIMQVMSAEMHIDDEAEVVAISSVSHARQPEATHKQVQHLSSVLESRQSEAGRAEDEKRMFQRHLKDLRQQTEYQRRADDETERMLFDKIQVLSQELSKRRQSIEVRHQKEMDREAILRRQLQALETATVEDLHQEILLRKDAAAAREKSFEEEATRLTSLREKGDPKDMPEKEEIADCLSKLERQHLLRIQLETLLESGEGEDTLRRHLSALKHAEFDEFLAEVKLHRQSDEATEAFLGSEVETLGADLKRHKLESEARRTQAQAFEAEIVAEMERFHKLQECEREEQSQSQEEERRERHAEHRGHGPAPPAVSTVPEVRTELHLPVVTFRSETVTVVRQTETVAAAVEAEVRGSVNHEVEGAPAAGFVSTYGWADGARSEDASPVTSRASGRGATRGASSVASSEASSEDEAGQLDDDRLNDLFDI